MFNFWKSNEVKKKCARWCYSKLTTCFVLFLFCFFFSFVAKLKKNETDCAFESRLGATIEVNRNYFKNTGADMVTVSVFNCCMSISFQNTWKLQYFRILAKDVC
jgi:hypothetical protein